MRKVKIGKEEVSLDNSILEFGETNLNEFLQKIGTWHAYYAEKHADATWLMGKYEENYDAVYGSRFHHLKTTGKMSDSLAEAAANCDKDVLIAHRQFLTSRRHRDLVHGFIRSIDKAFQAAMNYGYNKRKEMDKLERDIYETPSGSINDRIADVIANDS